MYAYWKQFPASELRSMVGDDEDPDDAIDVDIDADEEDEASCPRCFGCGCNYCLMTEW